MSRDVRNREHGNREHGSREPGSGEPGSREPRSRVPVGREPASRETLRRVWRGLLVSVRDAAEAQDARAGGAAIIDVKDPGAGPLGAASVDEAARIAMAVAGSLPLTLACGELRAGAGAVVQHLRDVAEAIVEARSHAGRSAETSEVPMSGISAAGIPTSGLHGFEMRTPAAVKAGPAGLDLAGWQRAYEALVALMPTGVTAVAVAYADWQACAAPPPERLIDAAADLGCGVLLLDTFGKAGGGVFACLPDETRAWIGRARAAGMQVAVAGGVEPHQVAAAVAAGADVVAVRTAACDGGRQGRVNRERVATLARAFAAADGGCAAGGCGTN